MISAADADRFSWSGLRSFQHAPTVAEIICERHGVPLKYKNNVQKQARQIRYCLRQASEYRDAAAGVSLATKPLLMYYSVMSLALAQILLKSDGNSSLDKARGEHAHHGLNFSINPFSEDASLQQSSSLLSAQPMLIGSKGRGTFELWHRTAREDPLIGRSVQRNEDGSSETSYVRTLGMGTDERLGFIGPAGLTLWDCLLHSPGMRDWLLHRKTLSRTCLGRVEQTIYPAQRAELNITIHPYDKAIIDRIADGIRISPNEYEQLTIRELNSGFSMSYTTYPESTGTLEIPRGTSWDNESVIFYDPAIALNEFGFLYVGLYILGNLCRYHPDVWLREVESGTALSSAAEELLAVAGRRMALLTLSDFTDTYYVFRA